MDGCRGGGAGSGARQKAWLRFDLVMLELMACRSKNQECLGHRKNTLLVSISLLCWDQLSDKRSLGEKLPDNFPFGGPQMLMKGRPGNTHDLS